jgi:uncharacterized Zn finger protein
VSPFDRRSRGFFPPSRPLAVEGGIKAQSTRGAIGSSWWSRRFIDALEGLAVGGRLARGRTYARQGQVLSLDLAAGSVRATVQGSRPTPYRVRLAVEPFTELIWTKVEIALAEQAIYSAHLLAGDMPSDIEDVFAAAGAPLFPARPGDLTMDCNCPDWEVPCKHLAATLYLLGERFDADPFLILAWRGRDRERLLARLRELRGTDPVTVAPPGATAAPDGVDGATLAAVVGAAAALADLAEPTGSAEPRRFWLSPVPLPARPAAVKVPADLLLRQLPAPSAVLGGPVLIERLRPAYDRFAAQEDTP